MTVNTDQGAAYGAALLAGLDIGVWPDVDAACAQGIQITGSTKPQSAQTTHYNRVYEQYRQFYPALKASFANLS